MEITLEEILEEIDNKIIPNEHWNKIKDYITNLQEENEDLKDRLKVMEHFKNSLLEENEDYKSRCEKAIEFIKEEAGYDEEIRSCCCDLLYSDCDKLIELLGGDDKQ